VEGFSVSSQGTTQILVVDDHKTMSEAIAMVLRSKGYSVCTADSGRDALRRLKEMPLQLVISDLNMPRMSGLELISAIRWRFPNMPVIAMSGTYTVDQIPRTVDAFYAKGKHSPDMLASMVEGLLSGRHKKELRVVRADDVRRHTRAA
jgi:DNA-binding NtrC family response regulator